MIQTVVSDLGNVLLHFDHMLACRRLAERSRWSPQEIYDSMFASGLVGDYELGRVSSEAFARQSMERLELDLEVDEIREIWSDIFHPVEGMEELMRFLKERYTLVLLSNTNEWHFEHCRERFPVVSLFDHFALSYRLGCRKPDREIFERALAMADAAARESIYFDDIPGYVEVAQDLEMRALCFENRDKLTVWLRAEGVRCPGTKGP
jgi:putative hydrolase of the HAD superfamily